MACAATCSPGWAGRRGCRRSGRRYAPRWTPGTRPPPPRSTSAWPTRSNTPATTGPPRAYDSAYEFCTAHDQDATGQLCRACATAVLFASGHWDRAVATCREVLAHDAPVPHAYAVATGISGLIAALRGRGRRVDRATRGARGAGLRARRGGPRRAGRGTGGRRAAPRDRPAGVAGPAALRRLHPLPPRRGAARTRPGGGGRGRRRE